MAGGRIDIEVGIDARNVPGQLERGMQPVMGSAKKLAGAFGLALGAGTVAAGVKQIISIGNDYTNTMNTLQSVSSATEAQMASAGQRAKELGNDIQLPGTSASDAAAAMTELAKGGFTVEQSMSAAKGTLQLAAAAQIDAASAATIQSQALQSFGLNADYAATAADVLANAANASSAEITDIAGGLAQSGAVANQFGLSIEDTAATLGVLANAGIAGSDAGTLLKSTLLALTDQSNPAQGAIEELGLTVYDAQGQFVGMSELFGQLDAAAASMSPELYQAATATLFGSDAMRLAGVAAEQGRAGYDSMRDAVGRQGAAAEVAAAKTKGLPGALEQVTNSAESLALQIYELIDGPLEGFAKSAAEKITSVTPGIISAFSDVGDVMGTVGGVLSPFTGLLGDAVGAFRGLPAPVQAVAVALGALKLSGGTEKIGGWVDGITEKFKGFRAEMQGEIDMQSALGSIGENDPFAALTGDAEALSGALEENAEPLSELASGLATLERRSPAVRNMAEGYRGVTTRAAAFSDRQRELATNSGAVSGALRNAAATAGRFGGIAGGAAVAGVRGLTSAAKGAIGVLGGPWMVGIMAATYIVGELTSENSKANRQMQILQDSSRNAAAAQTELAKAFQESKGAMSDQVFGAVVQQVEGLTSEISQLSETGPSSFGIFRAAGQDIAGWFSGVAQAGTDAYNAQEETASGAQAMKDRLDSLGMSSEDLANKLTGSQVQFDTFAAVLRNSGDGGEELATKLAAARASIEQAEQSAKSLSPGFLDIADSIRVIADASSSADEKTSALKRSLDVLAGIPVPLSQAVAEYEKTIAAVATTSADATDKNKGFGDSLLDAGKLNLATENGRNLQDTILGIRDATAEAAFAGADQNELFAKNEITFGQLANQYGVGIDKIREFAVALGLVPDTITTLVAVQGADAVTQQLQAVAIQFAAVPGAKEVEVKVDDQLARENLRDLGFKVTQLPNGNVKVEAPNAIALTALQEVIDRTIQVGAQSATPKINADTTGFRLSAEQSRAELQAIDLARADPKIGAIIADLLAGKEVSLAALNQLDTTTASPEVILAIQRALADADVVDKELDRIANKRRIADIAVRVGAGQTSFGAGFSEAFPARAQGGANVPNGALVGPGTGTSDSMLMYSPGFGYWKGSNGEHVFDAGDVDAMGGQENVYRFRAMLQANKIPMDALLDGLPGRAEGGALDRVRDLGSRGTGGPYAWGGADLSGADCSGWVAMLQRAAMGQGESGRLGTTYDLLDGNWPGLVPGNQGPFVVGVNEEHMAATIDGTNYESSEFMQMGGSAAGANDPQFTNQYYLPWDLFSPPYDPGQVTSQVTGVTGLDSAGMSSSSTSKKAQWSDKDDLSLDSARIAITQAQEDLDSARANPKKTDADKAQASKKVELAEQKVKDLEARKDAAAKGLDAPPAPQAPELETNYTDDELTRLDAEAAVTTANKKRNEVYADVTSTPEDRSDADRALQRAKNALNKKDSDTADSGTGAFTTADQWSSAIGGIFGDFVTENLSDVLGYYGADQISPFAKAGLAVAGGLIDMQKKQDETNAQLVASAPSSTQEELQSQMPATPGTPEWLDLMLKGLLTPAKLFDTGGEWDSGTLGYNGSGYKELVLNHEQREQVGRDFALLKSRASASVGASSGGSSDPFSGQRPIEITANGYDRREITAGIRTARVEERFEGLSVRVQG